MPIHSHIRSAVPKPRFVKIMIVAFCGVAAITSTAYSAKRHVTPRHVAARKTNVVSVVQHDKLAKGAKTVVMLRRHETPQTVILVDPRATPSDLAGAFSAVNRLRERLRDTHPENDLMLVPKPVPGRRLSLGAERRMQKYLTALDDNRNMARIRGLGDRRAITVVLPVPANP